MALYAIGDIHGCAKTLNALLDRIAPSEDDHLVFVGDYIDRGPDSKGAIDRLIQLKDECKCTFLRGNHEAMMLDFLNFNELGLWRINGGQATLDSYRTGKELNISEEHESFIRNTLLYYDDPAFFFVHAGLKAHLSIEQNIEQYGEEVYLWERSHLAASDFAWEKPVVCGHTPQREPIDRPELICIDTGCVYHTYPGFGYLTAVKLPEREMIRVYNLEYFV